MAIAPPFNLTQWIAENRELLKPPIGNKNLYVEADDYIVMIVAGPNARKDYHYNETEELFYQIEGNITVVIQEDGQRKEMKLVNISFLQIQIRDISITEELYQCQVVKLKIHINLRLLMSFLLYNKTPEHII